MGADARQPIKDNIGTATGCNHGRLIALLDARPSQDSHIVARMREAGGVGLGKTNLSEWANFRSTRSSATGGRGGPANPHALDRNTPAPAQARRRRRRRARHGDHRDWTDGSIVHPRLPMARWGPSPPSDW